LSRPATSASGRWRKLLRRRLRSRLDGNSLRARLLLVSAVALLPLAVLASVLAVFHATDAANAAARVLWFGVAALPVLLTVTACLAIAVAAEAWILRWLLYFERVARAYAHGRYALRSTHLEEAPGEFRALGEAVNEMAVRVQRRDQALRQALDEQTMLLREVHHRVKNNLQIVASLLSLQASRGASPEVKDALTDALVRLDAMGLAQRFMQEDEEHGSVSARQLFEGLGQQLRARLGPAGRRLSLLIDVDDRPLSLDVASPLVLISSEAVMQAFRRHPPDTPLLCRLHVDGNDPERVEMSVTVENEPSAFEGRDGISRSLIEGYVRQIRGKLTIGVRPACLMVEAPLRAAA
jgi:two-component sensor histidine kinase